MLRGGKMGKTALELTPRERKAYRPLEVLRKREESLRSQVDARWLRARKLADQAAKLLYDEFGAERVVLFGSAAQREWFTLWSDVDLAVWGVRPEQFYTAVAMLLGLNDEIKVDLVDAEQCSPEFRSAIERDGIDL